MQNVESFYNELTPILEKIKESPEAFLEGTEVSKVTLWRWTNGINRKYPDPHKLLSILMKISGKKNFKEIISYFGGEIESYLSKSLSMLHGESFVQWDLEVNQNEILTDFQSFMIFVLCEMEAGATKEELIDSLANLALKNLGLAQKDVTPEFLKSYGEIVEKKIQELMKKDALIFGDDCKYHTKKKEVIFNTDISLNYFPEMIRGFSRPEEAHFGFTTLGGYNQSIPVSVAKEIKTETREFFKRVHEKMINNKTKDGVPFQVIYWTDRLSFDSLNNSNEGDL